MLGRLVLTEFDTAILNETSVDGTHLDNPSSKQAVVALAEFQSERAQARLLKSKDKSDVTEAQVRR